MFLGSLREKSYKSFQILQILLIKKDLSDLYRFVRFLSVRTLKIILSVRTMVKTMFLFEICEAHHRVWDVGVVEISLQLL